MGSGARLMVVPTAGGSPLDSWAEAYERMAEQVASAVNAMEPGVPEAAVARWERFYLEQAAKRGRVSVAYNFYATKAERNAAKAERRRRRGK